MKKSRNIIALITLFIASAIFSINVFGTQEFQSYTMNVSGPNSATLGSNITLTFTASNLESINNGFAGHEGYINYDTSKLEFVSATNTVNGWVIYTNKLTNKIKFMGYDDNPPNNAKNMNTQIFKAIFKVLPNAQKGNTTITVDNIKGSNGAGYKVVANDTSIGINIIDNVVSKSNDANLSNLSVTGQTLSPAFTPDKTDYKVTVPNDVSSLNVSAVTNDPKAKVSITGNNNLSIGKNNIIVEVQAEDGTKKVYTIEVTRSVNNSSNNTPTNPNPPAQTQTPTDKKPTSKSSNNNLKSISGIPGLNFNPSQTNYDISIPFETKDLNVSAIPQDSKAKVQISNSKLTDLEVGKTNTITIVVTAEDSSVKVYTINVKRSSYESETGLKQLVVNNKDLLLEDNDDGEFSITVPSNVDKLDISAIPTSEGSTVKIKGNKNLKNGNNTIVVEVTDKNGFTKDYTINVEKESGNSFVNFLKDFWVLFLLLLLLLLIILLIIYLHRRNSKMIDKLGEDDNIDDTINYIDKTDNIVYNPSNSTINDSYVPKHADNTVDSILDDESVSEVKKEMKILKNEMHGDEELEKELTITENYRKK